MREIIDMIDNSPTFNGHNQITISHISQKRLLKLFKKLQKRIDDGNSWLELRYYYEPNSNSMEGPFSASLYKISNDKEILYCSFDSVIIKSKNKVGI